MRVLLAHLLAILLGAAFCVAHAQDGLPAQVRADVIKSKVVDAVRDQRMDDVLKLMDEYNALRGVTAPPVLRFVEAKAAEKVGTYDRMVTALEAYLKDAGTEDANYQEAIRWYSKLSATPEFASRQERRDDGVEDCDKPKGTLEILEPQPHVMQSLNNFGLQSPIGAIRRMVQQSNCFVVVERGGGPTVTADFSLTSVVVFSVGDDNGGLKFKEALTSLMLFDVRRRQQVAATQSSTRNIDVHGDGGSAATFGYANTNESKVLVAALLDNYNKLILALPPAQ